MLVVWWRGMTALAQQPTIPSIGVLMATAVDEPELKNSYSDISILSLQAFGHIGGTCVWADPVHEVAGVNLSVSPRLHRGMHTTNMDPLQNAVHAATVD